MPKLYFRHGCMNSSKTAQALMTKFNYEEQGYKVALIKPSIDIRDGTNIIKSRIGLESKCITVGTNYNFLNFDLHAYNVLIIDEAQFLTAKQVDQLKLIAIARYPVLCFGLKTDFQTHLFEGSKRLLEIADSVAEIKSVCRCGKKAECNARIENGKVVRDGDQILIGGNEKYIGMCYSCWLNGKV